MEKSKLAALEITEPESVPLQLSLRASDIDRFTKLFYEPEALIVGKKATIQLHVLRIDSGEFALAELYESLADASITYALSRTNAAKYFADPRVSIVNKVREKFRLPELKSGEGGEVLLYTFLESHLVAPKLLSKLELKTANDDYVKGADGIHLRQSIADLELIFGESKMHSDGKDSPGSSLQTAIADAFNSMATLRDGQFSTDKWLVENNLLKEAFDQQTVDALAAVLVPDTASALKAKKSFGVFLGYEIDIREWPLIDLDHEEIESRIQTKARELVRARIEYIRQQITKNGLGGYNFHFYMVPFLKQKTKDGVRGIKDVRFTLSKELSGKEPKPPKETPAPMPANHKDDA